MTAAIILTAASCFLLVALVNTLWWPAIGPHISSVAVAILIPARNEQANLPACLRHVTATSATEILIYDDHSSDNTAAIVQSAALLDTRIRLIPPNPLPTGWAGKTFACHTLAAHATSPWLLFLDADTHVTPDAPARLAAEAIARRLTLLSGWPRFVMHSFAERLLMPMLNFVVFSTFPGPLSLTVPTPSLGLAHGACILAHRETYLKLGGHALVRSELFEDTRLAQAWRGAGERALCLDAQHLVHVRMYHDFFGIWHGFQKNFYPAFRHNISFFAFLFLHLTVFLLPFILDLPQAVAVVLLTRAVLALRFRHPLWSILLHPFAEAVLIALGAVSFYRCVSGLGVSWKGRLYRA